MRKFIFLLLTLLSTHWAIAQEFPTAWKSKFSFTPDKWHFSDDGKYVLGREESQAEMLDGITGKPVWELNFKNDLKIKSLSRAVYDYQNGIVLFFNRDENKKNADKVIVDFTTGKELWRTVGYPGRDGDEKFHFAQCIATMTVQGTFIVFDNEAHKFVGLETRTGNKKWESAAYPDVDIKNVSIFPIEDSEYASIFIDNEDVLKVQALYLSILTGKTTDPSNFTSKGSNFTKVSANRVAIARTIGSTNVRLTGTMRMVDNSKIKFVLTGSGDVKWSKAFEGKAVRQAFDDAPYVKLEIQGDKIFVLSRNITVFDLKTGNQLWEAPYDNCDFSLGLKFTQDFGIAGWPIVSGNDVYYVDLENDNAIKKVNAQTGAVVWKSAINAKERVPNLVIVNGVLLAQFGGMINKQTYSNSTSNGVNTITRKNENRFDGNYGISAYDLNSGAVIWTTKNLADKLGDKFADRVTTIIEIDNNFLVGSDKNILCLDAKTGGMIYKTPISASKLGDVFGIQLSEDAKHLITFCDNGVASLDAATGKVNYATKTDDIFWRAPGSSAYLFDVGANAFLWVGEKDFIGFDLAKGVVKGKMKDNTNPSFTDDGNYVFVRDGEKMTKFSINK